MRPARLLLAVALCLAPALLSTSPAAAQTKDEVEARKSFELGSKLYAEHALKEAAAAFQRAYQLDPRPSSLQNYAQCVRDLQDFAAAYELTEELLRRFGDSLKADKLEAAKRALEELGHVTGSLTITAPEGARIVLDGKELGAAPLAKPVRVGLGGHVIEITKSGFLPLVRRIEVHASEAATVAATLAPELTQSPVAPPIAAPPVAAPPSVPPPIVAPSTLPPNVAEAPVGSSGGLQRGLGYAGLGLGVVGLGIGAVTGAIAIKKHSDLATACPTGTCFGDARSELDGYNSLGAVSTATFIAGGALLGAGVIALLTAPSGSPKPRAGLALPGGVRVRASVQLAPGFLGVKGSF